MFNTKQHEHPKIVYGKLKCWIYLRHIHLQSWSLWARWRVSWHCLMLVDKANTSFFPIQKWWDKHKQLSHIKMHSCGASGGRRPTLQCLRSSKGQTHETTQCSGLPDTSSLCSWWRRMQEACYRCAALASQFLLPFDRLGSRGLESRWSEPRITLSAKDIKVGKQDTAGYSYFLLNMSGSSGSPHNSFHWHCSVLIL